FVCSMHDPKHPRRKGLGRFYWNVKRAEDYKADFAYGAKCASQLLAFMVDQERKDHAGMRDAEVYLWWVMNDFTSSGTPGDVECGFIREIARWAMRERRKFHYPDTPMPTIADEHEELLAQWRAQQAEEKAREK